MSNTKLNSICTNCINYKNGCAGTFESAWTGCVHRKTAADVHKMGELFTAYYTNEDGTRSAAYEKPLEWIYSHKNDRAVEIRPTIWLWKGSASPVYFVDYVGAGVGCTLAMFDKLVDAEAYRAKICKMNEEEFETWLLNARWAGNVRSVETQEVAQ